MRAILLVIAVSIFFVSNLRLFAEPYREFLSRRAGLLGKKNCARPDLDFAGQTSARRPEGWMDFFAEDASIIHDDQTVKGKDALRAFYRPVFANKDFSLTWSPTMLKLPKTAHLAICSESMKPEVV